MADSAYSFIKLSVSFQVGFSFNRHNRTLAVGETSSAVQTSTGYDIIKVTDRKAAYTQEKKSQSTIENYLSKDA